MYVSFRLTSQHIDFIKVHMTKKAQKALKRQDTINPEVAKLTKKLIKKYRIALEELAKF